MEVFCKRCGKLLKSEKSIQLGYGPTCYKLSKIQDNPIDLEEEIKFLKIEIKMLKNILRELKTNAPIIHYTTPITRLKREETLPTGDSSRGQMIEVIQELKSCFQNCNGDVKSLLKPVRIELNMMEASQLAEA